MRHLLRLALPLLLLLSACGSGSPTVVENNVQPSSAPQSSAPAASATASAAPTGTLVPTAEASPTNEPTAPAAPTTAPTAAASPTTPPASPTATGPGDGVTEAGVAIRPGLPGKIAFVRDGSVYVYTPQNGAVNVLIEDARDPQFSRDGSQIAFVRDDGLYLAAADGSNARQIVAQPAVQSPRWADDGSKIAFERAVDRARVGSGEVWTFELASGTSTRVAAGGDPAWAPDSKRVAYVTLAPGFDAGGLRRNQLRLTNWLGQNDWGVVRQLPANTPPTGIPGGELPPAQLDHVLFSPLWDAAGAFIYVPAFAMMQVETDFHLIERADAVNGGSTYLGTINNVRDVLASPDRRALLVTTSSARGDISLTARALDPGLDANSYGWASAGSPRGELETFLYQAPSWSPASNAVIAIRCGTMENACDLVLLAPEQEEPSVLIPDLFGGQNIDLAAQLFTAWGR